MSDYNGWTNWETWNLFNWMTNTEGAPVIDAEESVEQAADQLRDQHMDRLDDMPHGFERDALTRTYEAVNWQEIVEGLTE